MSMWNVRERHLALLALFPCRWLPDYKPGEIPSGQPPSNTERD
jgi:hypothetical protein